MAISVACSCGKKLKVKEESAGRKVRCPGCGEAVVVPALSDDDSQEAPGLAEKIQNCPKCKNELDPGAVLCVKCGFNLKTRKMLTTKFKAQTVSTRYGLLRFIGSYAQVDITREENGDLFVTRRLRAFFIPVYRQELNLKKFLSVQTDVKLGSGGVGFLKIFLRWFFWRIQLDQYLLYLCGPKQKPVKIYQGWSQKKMHELVEIFKAKGLSVERK